MTTHTGARVARALSAPGRGLETFGSQMLFYGRALRWSPRAVRRYRREILRLLAEVSLGTGALAMIGGTVVIVSFLTIAAGVEIGLQGFSQLNDIGVQALAGFVSAYVNTREGAPLIAAIALVATVGGGVHCTAGSDARQ